MVRFARRQLPGNLGGEPFARGVWPLPSSQRRCCPDELHVSIRRRNVDEGSEGEGVLIGMFLGQSRPEVRDVAWVYPFREQGLHRSLHFGGRALRKHLGESLTDGPIVIAVVKSAPRRRQHASRGVEIAFGPVDPSR